MGESDKGVGIKWWVDGDMHSCTFCHVLLPWTFSLSISPNTLINGFIYLFIYIHFYLILLFSIQNFDFQHLNKDLLIILVIFLSFSKYVFFPQENDFIVRFLSSQVFFFQSFIIIVCEVVIKVQFVILKITKEKNLELCEVKYVNKKKLKWHYYKRCILKIPYKMKKILKLIRKIYNKF